MKLATEWNDVLKSPRTDGENWSLVLPFRETFENAFRTMCPGVNHHAYVGKGDRCIIFLNDSQTDEDSVDKAREWVTALEDHIVIRDCLSISFALDYRTKGGDPQGPRTAIGELCRKAKPYDADGKYDRAAARQLAQNCVEFLKKVTCYDSADCVVAMPPSRPDKPFDLPRYLAGKVASALGKDDLRDSVATKKPRGQLKATTIEDKLKQIEGTVHLDTIAFKGKSVLVVDDFVPVRNIRQLLGPASTTSGCKASTQHCVRKNGRQFRQSGRAWRLMRNPEAAFAIFRLLEVSGIGPARLGRILALADEAGLSLTQLIDDSDRIKTVLTQEQTASLRANAAKSLDTWRELGDQSVTVLSVLDPDYPKSMRMLLGKQTPPLLFALGNTGLLEKPSLSFCGSRKASEKGLAVARKCAEIVSSEGINVVSGYAAGVDMATHRAALSVGGTTTLVLADGIKHFRLKRELKDVWDWERAVVVSQYSPGLPWSVHNAMARNLTICALCKAMVLIEARESGGSMEAGQACLRLGIPLFAPVYEGMPESASGNRLLLGQGARSLYKNKSTNLPNLRALLAAFPSPSPLRLVGRTELRVGT